MLLGPTFRVELVAAARQRRYFLLRVVYAAIILFVLWVSYASMNEVQQPMSGGQPASISDLARTATTFFLAFTWVQLIGILAIAPVMAAGTIATERERRTIEYLFVSDLSNLEIVVGKTFARLLLVGQLVLVSLPILFIFRLLGGIPADLLAASFIIAASTATVLTSLSVSVSVWSLRSRDAVMRAYRILAVLIIVPMVLAPIIVMYRPTTPPWWFTAFRATLEFCWSINPMYVLAGSMSGIYAAGAGFNFEPVLKMAAWHLGLALVLIAWSTAMVRRVHLRGSSRGETRKLRGGVRWWDRYRWKPQLGDHAVVWKEAFAPTAKTKLGALGAISNLLLVVAALGWTIYFFIAALTGAWYVTPEAYFQYAATLTGVVGAGLMLLLAARAAGLVTSEKERDCWISLLATPLTGGEIMRGKMFGNLYAARWGFLILLITWLLGAVFDVRYLLLVPVLASTFFLCTLFVTNVGLHFSLISATSLKAMSWTIATVFFIGGGYLFCCCMGAGVLGALDHDPEFLMTIGLAPCLPFLVCAPAMLFATGLKGEETQMLVAYLLGVVGYVIANGLLMADYARNFDLRAGRTVLADCPTPTDRQSS